MVPSQGAKAEKVSECGLLSDDGCIQWTREAGVLSEEMKTAMHAFETSLD